MRPHSSTPISQESIPVRKGVVVLSGYDLGAAVEHGHLRLSDGIAHSRRSSRFSRATCGIRRLVIHGSSGILTLQALRWLHDIGAAIVNIDADGHLVLAYGPQGEGPTHLRRAQVEALGQDLGVHIMRHLLQEKVSGQAALAERMAHEPAAKAIRATLDAMNQAADEAALVSLERQAAASYWRCWSSVAVKFARRHERKTPDHWRAFGLRQSPISGSPRNAANPANALLNYLYAILEAETRIALLTVGLDPGLGLLHTDQPSRDSLALDVMEAARPRVDEWLYELLSRATFSVGDFFERQDGTVRLSRNLTGLLAETGPTWAKEIAPVAEWVATELLRSERKRETKAKPSLPTPLTQSNRSSGRSAYRKRKAPAERTVRRSGPRLCLECGTIISTGSRKFCSDDCASVYDQKLAVPRFQKAGLRSLRTLRNQGRDPSHGGEAARRRGESNARRARERAKWEELGLDLDEEKGRFVREIQPSLRRISIRRIVEATGFSLYYASLVRRGMYVPHPMHYSGLQKALDADREAGSRWS